MKRALLLLIIIFSILGVADASYITWEKFQGTIPVCHPPFDCGGVLSSTWSSVGPIPLSAIGIAFYLSFFTLAVLVFLEKTEVVLNKVKLNLSKVLGVWSLVGAVFSLYLLSIMGLVLHAWCLYCLLSAINCFILLLLTGFYYKLYTSEEKELSL